RAVDHAAAARTRSDCPQAMRVVVRDRHAEALGDDSDVDTALGVAIEPWERHAHAVLARAVRRDVPAGALFELRGSEVDAIEDHGATLFAPDVARAATAPRTRWSTRSPSSETCRTPPDRSIATVNESSTTPPCMPTTSATHRRALCPRSALGAALMITTA